LRGLYRNATRFRGNSRVSTPVHSQAGFFSAAGRTTASKLAAALNIPIKDGPALVTLLDGIPDEAADLLKDNGICRRRFVC
jgi:hypothetical protein